MNEYLDQRARSYLLSHEGELNQLLLDLCAIPAPSNHEEKRAAFCRDWLAAAGGEAMIDEALNVICPIGDSGGDVTILMAHMDTVFPDMDPLPLTMDEEKIRCPGVGDDTANLAVLMMAAKYLLEQKIRPAHGLVVVCNSGEEGLGNLKGSRQIMKQYEGRVRELISFDGYIEGLTVKAVGSARCRVGVQTEGGHSFANFGSRNAIHLLSAMITDLYAIKVPEIGRTTYNVGKIEGGTSVNTIAQQASMLYEYRSDEREGLAYMEKAFRQVIEKYRGMGVKVFVEQLGERPCSGDVDQGALKALAGWVADVITAESGVVPGWGAGSTDANIPLSLGIPAVTPGMIRGGGAHTREEFLYRDSLSTGFRIGLSILLGCAAKK